MIKRKILDKGSYGIVIKNGFNTTSNSISKLFIYKQDFKQEIKNHKIISSIDYNNNFTIKLLNHSQIYFDDIDIHKKDYNQLKEFTKNKRIFQITYEYGGCGLHQFLYKNIDIHSFLSKFIHIIEGIKILQENNLIHKKEFIKLNHYLKNELFKFYKSKKFSLNLNKFDIYQLGLVLYQIILLINKNINKNIFNIIRKMLEPFPHKRTEIKNDFLFDLKKIIQDV